MFKEVKDMAKTEKPKSEFAALEKDIQNAYEGNVTIEEAERLAAKFLGAQLQVAGKLARVDLDARMKRSGFKAVKATIYIDEATKNEKKPTEAMLSSVLDQNALVQTSQEELDAAEVERASLERYLHIFEQAHVYFRQISRGKYE